MASNNYWQISLQESALFLLLNLIVLLFGIIMWYFIWIKRFGGEIPNAQLSSEKTISYFSSKNFTIVLRELFSHINSINKQYLIHTVGYEGYIYLLFQRTMISLLITVVLFSFIFSALNLLVKEREGQSDFFTFVQNFLLNNKYLNDFDDGNFIVSGTNPHTGLVEMIELKNHPFFLACQCHPEFKSRPLNPHPLFKSFIKASIDYQDRKNTK